MSYTRIDDRTYDQIRPTKITPNFAPYAEGSALIEVGNTKVICTATVEEKVPFFLRNKGTGWVTAEYSMLPRATHTRTNRETMRPSGRTQEIQRLIGRSLRAVVDMKLLGERQIFIDCDVLQADGGTRVTSVLGGYAALFDLCDKMTRAGTLDDWAITNEVGAVSVGLVDGEIRLDLDYLEDSSATADLNVIATANGEIIEVQGGSEGQSITHPQFLEMLNVGIDGVKGLLTSLKSQLK